jgi:hypothetical protein
MINLTLIIIAFIIMDEHPICGIILLTYAFGMVKI